MSWTAREDEAEAAALILASDGGYDGPTTLTASAAPTFLDLAAIASEVSGHTVTLRVVGADDWVAAQVAGGANEFRVRFTLGIFEAADRGFFAGVHPLLGTLLGREPRTARGVIGGHD